MTQENNHSSREWILQLAADIVSSYVANNSVPTNSLPDLIAAVYTTMASLAEGSEVHGKPLNPAVPIKKSITDDYIICLEDGKKLKMLKRYLRSQYNLTPEEYRAKWGLPPDYPMVAPNYAARRSEFAKQIGLGKTSGKRKARK